MTHYELTAEDRRIMQAILDDRMTTNAAGRYVIEGEARPDRRSRERLRKRGLIDHRFEYGDRRWYWIVTDKGKALLEVAR